MAEDYFTLKLYDDAIYQLYAALQVDSSNTEILEFLSDLLVESGQLDSAVSLARRLTEKWPDEDRYRSNLAGLYMRLDLMPEAIEQYNVILEHHPDDKKALISLSTIYIAQRDFQKALDISLHLYALDSTDDRVCFTIATLLTELDRAARADTFFTRAVELNPNNPRYFTNWAYLHMNAKDYARAVSVLESGTFHHPRAADMWALLGSAYERADQDSLALRALDRALELDASQVGPYITLGFIYDNRGDFDNALEVYDQALEIAPDEPLLLNNYAYLLAQRKIRLEEALRMALRAIEKKPDNPSYLDTMGWIYYGMGDYQKAREYIEQALERDPKNPVILEHLGDIFEALGDKSRARQNWRSALEFDRNNIQLREKLSRLNMREGWQSFYYFAALFFC